MIDADPVWVDIQPAGESVEGMKDHMILHSGPPISFDQMCPLHRRGMISGVLFEGWAKTEEEGRKKDIKIYLPPKILCTDNGAMIGAAAYYAVREGISASMLSLDANPDL